MGKTKRGKGTKIMAIADSNGLPVAICTESAGSHEIKLVTETIEQKFVKGKMEMLIGDKAYWTLPQQVYKVKQLYLNNTR